MCISFSGAIINVTGLEKELFLLDILLSVVSTFQIWKKKLNDDTALSAGAVEYTDCSSAKG